MPRPTAPSGRTIAVAAALCVGLVAVSLLHRGVLARRDRFPPEQDLHYLPAPGALRAASLGYTELLADLLWVRQVVYFGDQFTRRGDFRFVDRYLKTAVALDPNFRRLYAWAGIAYTYSGVPTTNVLVRQSNEMLELGLEHFPTDWELNFMLGINYINELKTSDPEQKQAWKLKGAEYVRRAAVTGKGPPWLPVLVASILTKGGEAEAGIRHLEEILLTTEDENVRERVHNKLLQLRRAALPAIERHRDEFMAGWREHMPYAPSDFYVLLGPPPADVSAASLAIPEVMQVWTEVVAAPATQP